MERIVEVVKFPTKHKPKFTRVAAYARVSSDKDAMHHSLAAQVDYYKKYITSHPGWQFAGVFADEAKTGTKDTRKEFVRLLDACRRGEVDYVLTKSVSRFARNTLTLLETVRELKLLGIDVFFEEQNIHTMSGDGELILTFLASYAQEESLSASENQKWRIKKNFEEGKPWCGVMLGYRQYRGNFVIVPEEAEIVKRIYADYLSGLGIDSIDNRLNEEGILTQKGYTWHKSAVTRILTNYNYTGNLLLQRFYSENHITKRKCTNLGELPRYMATDTHEAIISTDTFNAVQAEMKHRSDKFKPQNEGNRTYLFSGIITCAICGKHYRRKTTATGPVWICSTYNSRGKKYCASKAISENTLTIIAADLENITAITAERDNTLIFRTADGHEATRHWQDRSRSESWTPEMRAETGRKTKERNRNHG